MSGFPGGGGWWLVFLREAGISRFPEGEAFWKLLDFLREKLVSGLLERKFPVFPRERLVSRKCQVFLRERETSRFPEGETAF